MITLRVCATKFLFVLFLKQGAQANQLIPSTEMKHESPSDSNKAEVSSAISYLFDATW